MNEDEAKIREDSDDEAPAEAGPESDSESAEVDFGRLTEIEAELAEARQNILYAQAETQNVRRRLEQEKVNAASYAATAFARDMLSVKDNLERALEALGDDLREDERIKSLVAGIEATGRELESVFQRHGIKRVEAIGRKLDPHFHQAMIEVPDAEAEPGTIVQEMQSGYSIKDRLLRPALVGVARAP